MNAYKLRAVIDHIRKQGRLPTDPYGNTLPPDEILVWHGLKELLTVEEQRQIRTKLEGIAEAEDLLDRIARAHADPFS